MKQSLRTRKDKQTDSLEEKEQDPFHVFAILTSPSPPSSKDGFEDLGDLPTAELGSL